VTNFAETLRPVPPPPGRILALDVGARRIGLAVSDALGLTAQGLETFVRTNIREDLARLGRLAEEREVSRLLIGDPKTMAGGESRQARLVREFGDRLAARTGLPVQYWDERLTSVEAERVLREGGARMRSERKGAVDRLAAVILLESYLQWCEIHAGRPGEGPA
jgi:putative holliday junction resolvase